MAGTVVTTGVGKSSVYPVRPASSARAWARSAFFRLAGAAALIAGLLFRRNMDAELMALRSLGLIPGGPVIAPAGAAGWFALLNHDPVFGLALLGLFDIVNYLLVGLIFLAVCVVLEQVSRPAIVSAGALIVTAVVLYLASNQAFTMLALSEQYAAATGEAQRSLLLAAGQAALGVHRNATYQGTSLYPSFLFISVAGLLLATAMLYSTTFGKWTARMGILANVAGLSYYATLAVAPDLVPLPLSISAVFLLAWYILTGRRLLQIGRE